MPHTTFELEILTGQIKLADMSSSIAENFISADGALDDFVKVIGWFVFCKYFLIARERNDNAETQHCAIKGRASFGLSMCVIVF